MQVGVEVVAGEDEGVPAGAAQCSVEHGEQVTGLGRGVDDDGPEFDGQFLLGDLLCRNQAPILIIDVRRIRASWILVVAEGPAEAVPYQPAENTRSTAEVWLVAPGGWR
ncbi:hypothetical protein [Catenuloplanes atrovinosus]|uniref:Uncharacterized protein n=1 Tax=Catenuloplanes atrovinosus TaxID=137266 RepID=A0AAE3YR50_9ACTN|nr:hypothetical protein [Catenuloplanes atrovinosus]MDR7277717.1 hypothetical protein [Catenuloplanes atrovinosus]